ncbi:MAG: hypothetical protein CMM52_13235 [Rhodospirillaceae bacterium]|nr:hypothetical protein [Rhodospirillaceae bacterium]|tara:strand:- start:80697 stop:81293 length:597 start_codon:yes stop_codon:yes gene_type:complete
MEKPPLPAARKFVDRIRALYAQNLEADKLWAEIRVTMGPLLADPQLIESSKTWPLTVEGAPKVKNLLFYEDPDYGFVFNATVRKAKSVTSVHDHGDVWTLYGLIEGHETMYRYKRTDDAPRNEGPAQIEQVSCHDIGPGDVDAVPPGAIHQEHGGPENSMAFIVRAQKAGTFKQRTYDLETGDVRLNDGPTLIPHVLS